MYKTEYSSIFSPALCLPESLLTRGWGFILADTLRILKALDSNASTLEKSIIQVLLVPPEPNFEHGLGEAIM